MTLPAGRVRVITAGNVCPTVVSLFITELYNIKFQKAGLKQTASNSLLPEVLTEVPYTQ